MESMATGQVFSLTWPLITSSKSNHCVKHDWKSEIFLHVLILAKLDAHFPFWCYLNNKNISEIIDRQTNLIKKKEQKNDQLGNEHRVCRWHSTVKCQNISGPFQYKEAILLVNFSVPNIVKRIWLCMHWKKKKKNKILVFFYMLQYGVK